MMDNVISFEFDGDDNMESSTSEEDDDSNATHHNYRYEIDPSTGALLLLQDKDFDLSSHVEGAVQTVNVSNCDNNDDNPSYLKVLESGETVLVTHLKEDKNKRNDLDSNVLKLEYDGDEGVGVLGPEWIQELEASTSTTTTEASTSNPREKNDSTSRPEKRKGPPRGECSYWSQEKVHDLLQTIQKHARQMRRGTTTKMKVWNDIAMDMRDLGYPNCNKDECAKKWSNMLRTLKLMTMKNKNPADMRRKWQFYSKVSQVVKLLSLKDEDDIRPTSKEAKLKKSHTLINNLLAQSRAQQEALDKAEADFQGKMKKLDEERDEILRDIKSMIQNNAKKVNSSQVENQGSKDNETEVMNRLGQLIGLGSESGDLLKTVGDNNMLLITLPEGTTAEEIVSMFNANAAIIEGNDAA